MKIAAAGQDWCSAATDLSSTRDFLTACARSRIPPRHLGLTANVSFAARLGDRHLAMTLRCAFLLRCGAFVATIGALGTLDIISMSAVFAR